MIEKPTIEECLQYTNNPVKYRDKKRVYDILDSLNEMERSRKNISYELKQEIESLDNNLKRNKMMCLLEELKGDKEKNGVGAIVVLGYDDSMKKYFKPLGDDAFFKKNPRSIYEEDIDQMLYEISNSEEHDGAFIIEDSYFIDNSNNIEVNPGQVLDQFNVPNHRGLSSRLGFKDIMGTRHSHGKAASYVMPDATIAVSSEERGEIRVFEAGKTIYSPLPEEIEIEVNNIEKELVTV